MMVSNADIPIHALVCVCQLFIFFIALFLHRNMYVHYNYVPLSPDDFAVYCRVDLNKMSRMKGGKILLLLLCLNVVTLGVVRFIEDPFCMCYMEPYVIKFGNMCYFLMLDSLSTIMDDSNSHHIYCRGHDSLFICLFVFMHLIFQYFM